MPRVMTVRPAVVLAAVAALLLPAGADAARTPKAIVLGIDGGTADVMERVELPAIEGIASRGVYSRTTLVVPPLFLTLSGPGWATMATGTWPSKHGIVTNTWPQNDLERFPSVLERLERTVPGVRTAGFSVWPPIVAPATAGGPILGPSLDVREQAADDAALGRRVGAWIRGADVDATFVQFDDVDGAGHGSGAETETYKAQLRTTDAAIGAVLEGIRARPSFAAEDWLVVVSSDHGHNPEGGHGGPRPRERTTYVIAEGGRTPRRGGGLVPGGSPEAPELRLVDVAPSVLDHLGVTPEPAWGLDGRPFWAANPDPFDTLEPSLRGGVTDTTPAGWRTSGWRFGTDPWWTTAFNDNPVGDEIPNATNNPASAKEAELDERENVLGGRGVRAIADAAAAGGTLDATLESSPYDVRGARSARVVFQQGYRGTADQTAEVTVRFDGGAPRTLRTYAPTAERGGQPDPSSLTVYAFEELKGVGVPVPVVPEVLVGAGATSKVQQGPVALDVAVPAGARSMRVGWRLRAAGSGWFWQIDEPSVVTTPPRDDVRPVVRGLRVLLRRGVSFDLSERARVVVRVTRGGRRVATLRRTGRAGRNVLRLRPGVLRAGRRHILSVVAVDAAGNRSARRAIRPRPRVR